MQQARLPEKLSGDEFKNPTNTRSGLGVNKTLLSSTASARLIRPSS